ncbi:hypothetical protein K3495_g16438, partial [Podosphaera aphanis]
MNRTLMDLARAMLIERRLPEFLWGEAVLHASWIRNRSPTATLHGKTPIEVLTKTHPNLSIAQEFGKDVYVLEEISRPKTQPRARKVIFTGFEDGSKAIRYYDQNTMRIKVSRNYYFVQDQITEQNKTTSTIHQPQSTIESQEISVSPPDQIQQYKSNSLEGENSQIFKPILEPKKSNQTSRCLRSTTGSGATTRKNYADLAGFNPREHIRKPKAGNSVYTASEGRLNGDF